MRRYRLPALWLAMTVAASTCGAQEGQPVFRSGVSLIRVDAEALDADGRILTGLKRDDFQIFDDGARQPVAGFSFEEEPLDLILLFDLSGGMRSRLLGVVRAVELGFHELKQGDRVCVMGFHRDAEEIAPFTSDLDTVNETILLKVLAQHFAGDSKPEKAGADAALRFRREPKTQRRRAVLAITDRIGTSSFAAQDAIRELWQQDVVFSELEIGRSSSVQVLERGGNPIALKTGGSTVVAGPPGQAFQQALRLLRRRYTLYYASPGGQAGTERSLEVRLSAEAEKRTPGSHVRSRTGYLVARP
jgi:VWFA-related protein